TRVLLHLVSAREEDPAAVYNTIRGELAAYGHGLTDKAEIVALSQVDLLDDEARAEKQAALAEACGRRPLLLSSATGEGVQDVLRALMKIIQDARAEEEDADAADDRWQK
ncbi:MAG: GTPase ObgE, partial [Nitratireductor rhodophyticola]